MNQFIQPAPHDCLVILPTPAFGGHEKMLFEWLREAQTQGLLAPRLVSAPNDELLAEARRMGILVEPCAFDHNRSGRGRGASFRNALTTWRMLKGRPRGQLVLFAPGTVQTRPTQLLVGKLRRQKVLVYVPMAYSSHEMAFRFARLRDFLVKPLLRFADLWITITDRQRDVLLDRWEITSPTVVIPNRVTLAPPVPKHDSDRDILRVVFIGRFEPNQKGLDWLAQWIRQRASENTGNSISFTFQGAGPYEVELRRLEADLGANVVTVEPWGDISRTLASADVLLLPSRFEGLPLVAIEAVHQGVAIVATHQSGLGDYVDQKSLFDFGDARGLEAALRLAADPHWRADAVRGAAIRMAPLRSKELFEASVASLGSTLLAFEASTT